MATAARIPSISDADLMPTRDFLLNAVDTIGVVEAFTMPSEELEALQLPPRPLRLAPRNGLIGLV
jgi:hypothetical protein